MRFYLSLSVALLTAWSAFAQDPKPVPLSITIKERPPLATMEKRDALVGELIRVSASSPSAQWEIVPATPACDVHPDGKGNATISAIESGVYYAICYDGQSAKWLELTFAQKIKPLPPGPNPPGPTPPGPNPPGPTPSTKSVKRFIIVEDTKSAGAFRGQIMGSSTVQTYYKANGLSHRLIPISTATGDDETMSYVAKAAGKALPWMWLLDDENKEITNKSCPTTTPEAFVLALSNNGEVKHVRKMGNIPPPNRLKFAWNNYGSTDVAPMIKRSDWKEVSLEAYLPEVLDQDGVGACNAFDTVNLVMGCRAQAGLPYRRLSPGYLYGNINGQRDDGSLLEDAMSWMITNGTCLESTVGDLVWQKSKWPVKAAAEAKNFTVIEAYLCPTFDHLASAVQEGFFLSQGIQWWDNFTPDADGWLPARGQGNWGGHAVCGFGLVKRGNVWGIATRNSWGDSWGKKGNFVIPETLFTGPVGGWWAVRAVNQIAGPVSVVSDPFERKVATISRTKFPAYRAEKEYALAY